MLKFLRDKKTAKKIWIVLALIIVPAFIFWGFGGALRSEKENTYIGTIFGKKITLLQFKEAYDATRNQALMQFGEKLPEVEKFLNLESQAWDRLVLLFEAKRRKLKVSDKEVIDSVESNPNFLKDGQFDNGLYTEILRFLRIKPRQFEEQTRQNLILAKLYAQITQSITVAPDEIKAEYRKATEEISVTYIVSNPADFAKGLEPGEEELKGYFEKNQLDFKQPLSFNLEYFALDSQEKIEAAAKRVHKKTGLKTAADELKLEIKETGLFAQTEPIPGIGWSPQITTLAATLKVGETTMPLQLDKTFYLFRLKEKKEAYIPEFSAIKDKVKEAFIKTASTKAARQKIEACYKTLQEMQAVNPKQPDFNKAAAAHGLKSDTTALFKFGSYIEGIGASDTFWVTAQELKEGEISSIISLPSGFYVISLKSKITIDETKFGAEKEEFSKELLSQKKQEYFSRFIEELKKRAQ
jgi:peptidyl-prolyl cis-trans isomerase D